MMVAVEGAGAPPKPRLRGVSHQVAFFVALVASTLLVASAAPGTPTHAAVVFGAGLVVLFGTSALYHRVDWAPVARQRLRRADHSAIFVLIAAGYTPLFAIVPSSTGTHTALAVVWGGAALGVLKSLAWPSAPKWITAALCLALGWTVLGPVVDRAPRVSGTCMALLVTSGVVYSGGALVYALKRPDPLPRVFGYHEVFHALVVVASACLFAHVVLVLGG